VGENEIEKEKEKLRDNRERNRVSKRARLIDVAFITS